MAEDQSEVIEFLGAPPSYGTGINRVERIETHCSIVFLAGERAYKLKRAVKYAYLDFSTAELRKAACETELALNRRTAPELYLEVKPIHRAADGTVGWDHGAPLDWLVVMRRFDQSLVFDRLAQDGRLDRDLLHALVAHIVEFHQTAEILPQHGGAAAMRAVAETNLAALRACRAAEFAANDVEAVETGIGAELGRVADLLDRRRAQGKVRRCHGDLHLRNICLVDGRPTLFDCLEFSEDLASIDVLYDLAFLLMDLGHRGHRDLANLVLNRYLDLTGEDDGLAAMPLFLSLRAAIRAHVAGTMLDQGWTGDREATIAEARCYLSKARRALDRKAPHLIAIGGLSGSGKSTLAATLAPELGTAPGARVLRSDVLRKRKFGVAPETAIPAEGYAPGVTSAVCMSNYATEPRSRCGPAIQPSSTQSRSRRKNASLSRQ